MRGDRPTSLLVFSLRSLFTPHARGSTLLFRLRLLRQHVYPACAGIDLGSTKNNTIIQSLPRMRGDRPVQPTSSVGYVVFTPHARGSTAFPSVEDSSLPVYPACAGIDLFSTSGNPFQEGLPRMRGDRPLREKGLLFRETFTPHARGSTEHSC